MNPPLRGEVWMADLNPTKGREQHGRRPVLVVSHDVYNRGPAGLVIALPITSTDRNIPVHIPVEAPEGGLKNRSVVMCDGVRCISKERLIRRWGRVLPNTLFKIEDRLRLLLSL